jgi:hypothetical protein
MKICITGERKTTLFNNKILEDICKMVLLEDVEFLFGDCDGVDAGALKACQAIGAKYTVYPADWRKHGLAAGPIRNKQMIDLLVPGVDKVWAYHSDIKKSKGTKNTIKLAKQRKIEIVMCNIIE